MLTTLEDKYQVDGRAVRNARLRKHLTQKELAEEAGISYPTISRIENGKRQPRWSTIEKLAKALNVSPQELTTGQSGQGAPVMPQKIAIKEAVSIAVDGIQQLYEPTSLQDLLLEEVERGPSNDWYVTMSFIRVGRTQATTSLPSQERVHKRLRINAETGAIVSMMDKQLEADTLSLPRTSRQR